MLVNVLAIHWTIEHSERAATDLISIYTSIVLHSFSFLITSIYINSSKSVKVRGEMKVKNVQSGDTTRTCILITSVDTRTQLGYQCSGTGESLGLNSDMHIN